MIGGNTVATHAVGNTGGWQQWETHDLSLGELSKGNHNLTINVEGDGFNLNWLSIVEAEKNQEGLSRPSYTAVGGSGNIAGALSVSCDTPVGFTVVDSLSEMIEAMNKAMSKSL